MNFQERWKNRGNKENYFYNGTRQITIRIALPKTSYAALIGGSEGGGALLTLIRFLEHLYLEHSFYFTI